MNLVVLADDAFTFLVSWEFMSLVVLGAGDGAPSRAARTRAPATSISSWRASARWRCCSPSACSPGPTAATPSTRCAPRIRPPAIAALVLMLALLGAGSKAGLVPLHVWLPLAHPAAPSHVSALMSGVMTKVAVYGFVRIVFDLLGAPAWWWSMVVLALGGITAVLGVLYALMQHDLKRLLAYTRSRTSASSSSASASRSPSRPTACRLAGGAGADRRRCSRLQPLAVQEPAVLRRRRGADATGERDMEHLGGLIHRMPLTALRLPGRLRRDLGAAAAQRLRLRMADLPGDPAQPAAAAMGPEVPGPGGRRAARAVGGARRRLLRQGLRRHLPRPAAHAAAAAARTRPTASRSPRCSSSPRSACSPASCRASSSTRWRRWCRRSSAAACRCRPASHWLSIVPIAESRSSYNGLLVFVFIAVSGIARRRRDPPLRLATRCAAAPAWDCGFPDPSPATQYTADSFAQPIRRVFGTRRVPRARARSRCRRPATRAPARLDGRTARSGLGRCSTRRSPAASAFAADRLNRLQFLTIRQYLSLVFVALVAAAAGARDMAVILDLAVQGAQMLLVLLLAPLLTGFVRKVKARLLRRRGPAAAAALSRPAPPDAQGGGACARTPPGCSASRPT